MSRSLLLRCTLAQLGLVLSLWSALAPQVHAEDDLFGDPLGDEENASKPSRADDEDPDGDEQDEESEGENQDEGEEEEDREDGSADDPEDDGALFDPDADNGGSTEEDEESKPGLRVQAGIGGGLGMRGLRRPTRNQGSQVLPDQAFPVIDLGLSAELWPERWFGLALQLRLQTSVFGFRIKDFQPLADGPVIDARSDRMELVVLPSLGLGEDDRALRIGVAVGGTLRSLWHTRHELNVPRYSLVGIVVRPQLRLLLGSWYTQAGPELQYFVTMDDALIEQGAQGTALGFGVELTVGWTLSERFALEATYRESYTRGSGTPVDLEESERHITARLQGTL